MSYSTSMEASGRLFFADLSLYGPIHVFEEALSAALVADAREESRVRLNVARRGRVLSAGGFLGFWVGAMACPSAAPMKTPRAEGTWKEGVSHFKFRVTIRVACKCGVAYCGFVAKFTTSFSVGISFLCCSPGPFWSEGFQVHPWPTTSNAESE